MSRIEIKRQHSMDQEHALRVADDLAREMASHYDMQWGWKGETLWIKRSGVNGEVSVKPSLIHVDLVLGMMLRPFRGRIEAEVTRQLDDILARNS